MRAVTESSVVESADPSTRAAIQNPVLRGFHPDPSILRVGGTYYLATSTFEWWPGVRVHRSDDLVTWTPCGHLLNEAVSYTHLTLPTICSV